MTEHQDAPVSLESILLNDELERRPSRPIDYEKESKALLSLTAALADSPDTILQTLADTILDVLQCGSAGVSLLTTHDGGRRFHWPAIAGVWKPHIGGGTPRDFGPCGNVLDLNKPLLMAHVERRYAYFEPVTPPVEEALLVPFYQAGKAVGTIWAVAHDERRKFDSEDRRQLVSLSQFASVACRTISSLSAASQMAAIVESSDDAIISKDLNGIIATWNGGAERLFGYPAAEAVGQHITLIVPADRRAEEVSILESLRRGERVDHFETVRKRKDGSTLDISLTISPVKDSLGRVVGASKVARDITERRKVEEARKVVELSARLLQVQDDERRRISRELHDGVGQLLAAVSMNINVVQREKSKLSAEATRRVDENAALIQEISADIRTVSYLLHPPMLDEIGLESALGWYVTGFAERSKISAKLDIPADWERLNQDHELCLFRIAQESLTNIHRHSGSSTALIKLSSDAEAIRMEVSDEGRGVSEDTQAKVISGQSTGVGLRGMHERVRLLGGTFDICSHGRGTCVRVTLPAIARAGSFADRPSASGSERPTRAAK